MLDQSNETTWAQMDTNMTQSSNNTTAGDQIHTTTSYDFENFETTRMINNVSNVTRPSEFTCAKVPNWCLPPPCIPCPPPRPTIFDCQPEIN